MSKEDSLHILRVKIWLEFSDSTPQTAEWRGEIKRLETGKTSYFNKLSGFSDGVEKLGIVKNKR